MHETPSDDVIYAALNSRSVTDATHALVESLRREIEDHETIKMHPFRPMPAVSLLLVRPFQKICGKETGNHDRDRLER
jgi:hypothetical protein